MTTCAPNPAAETATLVFHWRHAGASQRPAQQALLRYLPWSMVLLSQALVVFVLLFVVWLAPHKPGGWGAAVAALGQAMQQHPEKWMGLLAQMVFLALGAWVFIRLPTRSRLVLTHAALQYRCGIPCLRRWLDWQLDLHAVRAGRIPLRWAGGALMGHDPTVLARLVWGAGAWRGFAPAAWCLPGQAVPTPPVAHARWGLVRWSSTENQAVLRQRIAALPLIQALRGHDVPLPAFDARRQMDGLDLMAYARIRIVVIGFFVLMALAAVLYHLTRYSFYFVGPPQWLWILAGSTATLLALGWMWPERWPVATSSAGHAVTAQDRPQWPALRATAAPTTTQPAAGLCFTKCIVAGLFGLAFALSAPLLPLAWGLYASPARVVDFRLQGQEPLALVATDATLALPAIAPRHARAFWAGLPPEATIPMPVHQGLAGLWWQYDTSGLQQRFEAFYSTQSHARQPAQAASR